MPITATAGHVDHGKSTLVEALTGTDPDRLREEKERGLTIDLGFAWTDLDGHDVGFVDVPGHERFIKNMLAGVGAVDCALLVVAADSGWMPQTEEHASVLDLLDVKRGVIAITRSDLVDSETLELTTLETIDEVAGTGLVDWPIVAVSSTIGTGLDELRAALAQSLTAARPNRSGPVRMWIDRTFTLAGAGQVVTGTVMSGSIVPGTALAVLPAGESIRVRGLQHHGSTVDEVGAGDRTAIDLTGDQPPLRGDLLATPDTVDVTDRFLATLRPTRGLTEIPPKGAFHVHIGTTSRSSTLRRIGDGYLVEVDAPIPARFGDRIIVRDVGRKAVVGGGRILDTRPDRSPRTETIDRLQSNLDASPDEVADALVEVHGHAHAGWVVAATGGGEPTSAIPYPGGWLSRARATDVAARATSLIETYHAEHPTRPGIPKAELASRLDVEPSLLDAVVGVDETVEERNGAVAAAGFANELDPEEERRWGMVRTEMEASFDVPRMSALDLAPETVHFLLRRGDLVRVADDLVFTSTQLDDLVERVGELPDGFTVADFRDHFGMTRRQAVPTLEWLDSIGRTRRSGDGRTVRDR